MSYEESPPLLALSNGLLQSHFAGLLPAAGEVQREAENRRVVSPVKC